jgi:alpha-L-fucosidase
MHLPIGFQRHTIRVITITLVLGAAYSLGAQTTKPLAGLASEEVAGDRGFGMGPPVTAEIVAEAVADTAPIPAGPYQANWDSVRQHYRTPEWFRDAKFGIFLHWGLYSVPGYGSEWYEKHMYGNPGIVKWHAEHFGPQDKFGYKDLIPLFTCAKYDPDEWAALFKKSGARYVVPTAEHHDGWALWDSALTKWDSKDTGPHRDLIGELAIAVRKQGLKFGVSNHRIEHYTFINPLPDLKSDLDDPAFDDFYWHANHSDKRLQAFLSDWVARNYELIDKYQPDLIYFDNGVNHRVYDPLKLKVAAYYFNRAAQWGKEVSFATKSDAYLAGSIKDYERQSRAPTTLQTEVFQVDDSVHQRWGYLADAQYWKVDTIIVRLVENVCRNGNLLLNFSPRADGTIPEEQKKLLLGIGAWLDVNGDAIYGTRPWTTIGEGTLVLPRGQRYSSKDIRFTTKGDALYAIIMAWPENGVVLISSLTSEATPAGKTVQVELLGHGGRLEFSQDAAGLKVKLPATKPCATAYSLKITGLKLR